MVAPAALTGMTGRQLGEQIPHFDSLPGRRRIGRSAAPNGGSLRTGRGLPRSL